MWVHRPSWGGPRAWWATGDDVDEHPSVIARIHVATTSTRMGQDVANPGLARQPLRHEGRCGGGGARDCCSRRMERSVATPPTAAALSSWTNRSSDQSRDAGGSTAASLNTRASPTAPSSRSVRTTRRCLSGSPIHRSHQPGTRSRGRAVPPARECVPAPGTNCARDRRGCNLGCKLSATESNSEQPRPL
jgi:hypothetical protein